MPAVGGGLDSPSMAGGAQGRVRAGWSAAGERVSPGRGARALDGESRDPRQVATREAAVERNGHGVGCRRAELAPLTVRAGTPGRSPPAKAPVRESGVAWGRVTPGAARPGRVAVSPAGVGRPGSEDPVHLAGRHP